MILAHPDKRFLLQPHQKMLVGCAQLVYLRMVVQSLCEEVVLYKPYNLFVIFIRSLNYGTKNDRQWCGIINRK